MTLPDEGPEQRWRRTVRKRPAKLKLGRLLRDFGYAELDDEAGEAIEARMASVGLAIKPSLRDAAADEIVTVYRTHAVSDDAATATAIAAVAAKPREPADPPAPKPSRPKARRAATDPGSAREITDLKGQLADARAESARLRTELDGRIAAMADAERTARERLAEQSTVVEDQAHRLAELSGLLNETRAALAEARDEIRRAVGDLPAAVVEAPIEDGGLSEEEGWLTDADEPLPPVEAAVSAVALPVDDPDERAPGEDEAAYEPDADLGPLPMDDVFAAPLDPPSDQDVVASDADAPPAEAAPGADAEAPPDGDLVFAPEVPARADVPLELEVPVEDDVLAEDADAPVVDDVFGLDADAPVMDDAFGLDADAPVVDDGLGLDGDVPVQDDVFSLDADAPVEDDMFRLEAGAPVEDDVFGPPAEARPGDEVFTFEPAPESTDRPPEPPRRSGFFTLEPQPPSPDVEPVAEAGATPEADPVPEADPPPADDAATGDPAPAEEWRLDDDAAAALPAGEMDLELADWQVGEIPAEPDGGPFDVPDDGFEEPLPAFEPAESAEDAPSTLPPPPPLPPSPFGDELPAVPPELGERPSGKPAKRGRMARGRGRWQGTCSVCERFPEVTRRKDLEAAGWQLDGDFPTCPQCRGVG